MDVMFMQSLLKDDNDTSSFSQHVFVQLSSFHYNSYVINIYKALCTLPYRGLHAKWHAVETHCRGHVQHKMCFFIIQCTNK